jgi:hypothetical protein
MLIVHKASLDSCEIRRSEQAALEVGLRLGEQLYYPCGIFATAEMREAVDFYRSCNQNAIIVSNPDGFEVWCELATPLCADSPAACCENAA